VVTGSDVVETAVAIRGDKIVAIGPESLLPPADRVIDASGKYVLPGLIDCHLHVGPEYDDWRTAPAAAARTGLTTLLPFVVYDEGETLPKAIARLREEAEAASVLGVTRQALSNLLNERTGLSPDMALRIEKAFGPKMDHLMRMQLAFDLAAARRRETTIKVKRFVKRSTA